MEFVVYLFVLTFTILGIAAAIRYAAWKLTDCKHNKYHYIVLLHDSNAELVLRSVLERNSWDIDIPCRRVYAVDLGLDKETRNICEKLSYIHPQIILCNPEQIQDLL